MSTQTIATLAVEMVAKLDRLQADMDQAKRVVSDSMKGIEQAVGLAKTAFVAFAGIASVDAFVGMVRGSIEATAKLHDLAAQTGATVESLSAMGAIGKTSGTDLETISSAMNKLAKNMAGATEDTKGAGKALEAIGIDFTTFKSLSPDEQMQAVAKAMDQFADGSGKSAVAMALYGKEGAKLIPFLKDLAEVGDLHAKVTAQQAAMADNFSDNLVKLKASGEGWKKELSMAMLPALNEASQAVLDMTNGTGGLRETIRQLSADGTIEKWTRSAITGLSYLLDAVQILVRAFNTLIIVLGSTLLATFYAMQGKFEAAGNALKTVGAEIADQWSDQTIGQKFRARLDEVKGLGQTSEEAKPKLDFTNVMSKNKDAADKQTKAYNDLLASIREKIAATNLETESGGKLTEAQKQQLEINKQVEKGTITLKDATSDKTKALLADLEASERAKAVQEDLRKINEEVWKDYLKHTDALQKNAQAIKDKVRKQLEENDAIGKTKAELLQLEIARLRDEAATLGQIVQQEEYLGLCTRETVAHQDTLAALNKLIEAKEQGVHLQAAKEAADAWEKTAKIIESSLTDALMRGFEAGKTFGQNLKDSLINLFKTLILRPIIQPIAQGMAGTVLSAFGMPASASTGAGGGSGGWASMLNFMNGSTISNGVGSAFNSFAISNVGSSIGLSTPIDYGTGYTANVASPFANSMGSYLGMAGNAVAGYGIGKFANNAISNGYSVSSGMNTLQDIATVAASAIFGPVGGAIAGAVSGLVNRSFGRKLADQGIQGTFSGGGFEGQSYQFYKGGWFRSDKTKYGDLDAEMGGALAAGAGAIYDQVKQYAEALKLPADELKNVSSYMKISLTDDAAKNQKAIAEVMTAYGDALVAAFTDQLTPFQRAGEKLIDTMQRLTVIENVSQLLNGLGGAFGNFAHASVDARESIINLTGGLDALIQKAQGFVSNYYSQNEQGGLTAKAVEQGLIAAGFTAEQIGALSSRGDYRALLEGVNVNTDTGQKQFAALLNLQDKFASVSALMGDQKLTLDELAKQAPTVAALDKLFTPTQSTAQATQNVADGVATSNTLLGAISGKLDAISAASDAAVAAANSAAAAAANAAGAASSAASAASSAASSASLAAAAPTYSYDIGGGGG